MIKKDGTMLLRQAADDNSVTVLLQGPHAVHPMVPVLRVHRAVTERETEAIEINDHVPAIASNVDVTDGRDIESPLAFPQHLSSW